MAHASQSGDDMPRAYFLALLRIAALVVGTCWGLDTTIAEEPSATKLRVPDDLAFDVVLSDPLIAQPLQISFDERGRLWLVEYRQYPMPAGLTLVSRDNFWRSVYDKTPLPPPHGTPGKDRISIHEDTNGDGTFDSHKVFVDGLNIVTSICRGRGGVWVLNPPYLLFYPDLNNDDVPDSDPIVHLQGFGLEDTHSCVNSLQWGPDGWLYACQGSTVSADVIRTGIDTQPVHSLGQLVWRYHPETRRYEIFAEGGGNAFGLEFDSKGRIFSGHNGGDTRGFHYVQGGYSQKGFNKHGPLSNPFAFGYFPAMRHHAVPRFTHTFVVYEATGLPEAYRGHLFGVEPLQGTVVESRIFPDGSTFQTADLQRVIAGEESDFRPVDIKVGPDGAMYVADWRDSNVNHLKNSEGSIDTTNGRVFRLRAKDAAPMKPFDLGKLSSLELVELLRHDNKWQRQQALALLGDRRDFSVAPRLREMLAAEKEQTALEALWALNLVGGLDEATTLTALRHVNPYVRAWAARLACDDREVSPSISSQMAEVAQTEANVEVRSQLASSARRLKAEQGLPIVAQLMRHDEDVDDPYVPLLIWWAIEAKCADDRDAVVGLFQESSAWQTKLVQEHLASRVMRRFAQAGSRKGLLTCAELLKRSPDAGSTKRLLAGFEEAFAGRSLASLPDELVAALSESGQASLALRLRQGEPAALAEAVQRLADDSAEVTERRQLAAIFGEVQSADAVPVMLALAGHSDNELRRAAIGSLQRYDDPAIPAKLVELLPTLPIDAQPLALSVLGGRAAWARVLLERIKAGEIDADLVPSSLVNNMLLVGDEANAALVREIWGDEAGGSAEAIKTEIARLTELVRDSHGSPYEGRKLFNQTCAKCHKLYDRGGEIGPDLTAYQRDNLDRMLANIVNPSAEIREGFENFVLETTDGRALTGFLADQDNQVVVLRTSEGQNVTVPREEIEELRGAGQSLMPEGLLRDLTDEQARDLFAYLRGTQPLAVED
jgi:putative membrane-bound dehydrogenase-like protein